jgi:hypothetical protein
VKWQKDGRHESVYHLFVLISYSCIKKLQNIKDIIDIPVDSLSSGKLVVVIMGKGHFTSSGHFIVLCGVTSEGKILVADPASV